MPPDFNLRDLAFKVMWTTAQALAAFAVVELADWRSSLVVPLTAGLTWLSALARQRLGTTPPAAESVDAARRAMHLAGRKPVV